jgi:hypothetical protein
MLDLPASTNGQCLEGSFPRAFDDPYCRASLVRRCTSFLCVQAGPREAMQSPRRILWTLDIGSHAVCLPLPGNSREE